MEKRKIEIAENLVRMGLASAVMIASIREKHDKKSAPLFTAMMFSIIALQKLSEKKHELSITKRKPQAATAFDLEDIPDEDLPGIDELIAKLEKELRDED